MLPEQIKKFIDVVSELPSIGPRQATRLAFHIVNLGQAKIAELRDVVARLAELGNCTRCFRVGKTETGLCEICRSPRRDHSIIAIVEKETDLLSLERTGKFAGRYLLLGELSKEGLLTSMQKLRLNHLKRSLEGESKKAQEIIIALSPTTYGDLDASLVAQELAPFAKKITRLGRGLPTGGEVEFADDETLGSALERRN